MSGNRGMFGFSNKFDTKMPYISFIVSREYTFEKHVYADILLVGGGGGGGADQGGGGGGGTYTLIKNALLLPGTYEITIGAGGAARNSAGNYAYTGGTTSAFGYSASGGTGGITKHTTGRSGGNCGDGVHVGGNGSNNIYGGGGGGGVSSNGIDPDTIAQAGHGGYGVTAIVNNRYRFPICGGGGGGNRSGTGMGLGRHGGGNGGYNGVGMAGVANSGGGGGGGSWSSIIYAGGAGGSGIVIVARSIKILLA